MVYEPFFINIFETFLVFCTPSEQILQATAHESQGNNPKTRNKYRGTA
jgi:hypothetical protein